MHSKRVIHLMGTEIRLSVDHETADLVLDEVVKLLKTYEHRFSANDDTSELMAINLNAGIKPVVVNSELFDLIKIGRDYSCQTDNNLNIAIGPLVQLWRIGFKDAKVPTNSQIKQHLLRTDPKQIILDEHQHTVFLAEVGMLIDLGSLAKGYIGDLIVDYFRIMKVRSALINLGGNVLVFGPALQHDDGLWRIGIRDPKGSWDNSDLVINARDQSIVTSGIYERQLMSHGRTYHHILDEKTGYPLETEMASLTIVSKKSIDGELWTTCLFGQPIEQALAKINALPDIEGVIITQSHTVLVSSGLTDKHLISYRE